MSDGVNKLIEYLNQTRRQAESAIDCLNAKIAELEESYNESKKDREKLKEEVKIKTTLQKKFNVVYL